MAVRWAGGWLQRVAPSRYEKIASLSSRAYGSPHGRTVAEWVLINKAVSPVMLPALLGLASVMANRRAAAAEGLTSAAAAEVLTSAAAAEGLERGPSSPVEIPLSAGSPSPPVPPVPPPLRRPMCPPTHSS